MSFPNPTQRGKVETNVLILTALSIGFIHTLIGPDHYVPFIAMARARKWSLRKTTWITLICGTGHVAGSVLLGFLGMALGSALHLMERIESIRGEIAVWLLIGFGIAYAAWGLRFAWRARTHTHEHRHHSGSHEHKHNHLGEHAHLHGDENAITPWALFVIFILGPCEPLIPLLMYPAAQGSLVDVIAVVVAFGGATVVTMLAVVLAMCRGVLSIRIQFAQRYGHAIAGLVIFISGLSIKLLPL